MLYTVLDAETTGKYPGAAMPVSVSYVTFNDKLERVGSGLMYFCDDSIPESDYGALQVHGLSKSVLAPYAKDFETNVRKLFRLLWRGNIVGYNSKRFDVPVLSHFLTKQGFLEADSDGKPKEIPVLKQYDLYQILRPILPGKIMPNGRKGGKTLTDAAEYFNIYPEKMSFLYKAYFGHDVSDAGYHNADYDTFVTAMLFITMVRQGYIKL